MAVVVDGICVIVRNRTLAQIFPGGLDAYALEAARATYCADDSINRVAFRTKAEAHHHVSRLVSAGLSGPSSASPDVVIATGSRGQLAPCDWLELTERSFSKNGQQHTATVASLRGAPATDVVAPDNWRPDAINTISFEDLQANYELVGVERRDGAQVETYRHRKTGELTYVPGLDQALVQERYEQFVKELGPLEQMRGPGQKEAAAALLERVTPLVNGTRMREPGPLMVQGMSARLAGRWEIAERAFRAVTVLRPSYVGAWLDLTWALASLGRLEEAESNARHALTLEPDDARALSNLASVLRERGKLDEALTTIKRAMALKKGDRVMEEVLDQIRKDQGLPWYKRLFVN